MASLKRVTHKSGRVVYRIVISLGYNEQGNKLVKNLTYSVNQSATPRQQEREALLYALEMEDRIKHGGSVVTQDLPFEEFARKWLASVREGLAYGTYIGYEQLLRSRILPYFQHCMLGNIKTADIEAFYKSLTEEYSTGTIRRCANVLNCIFRTAKRWNIIDCNPCQYALKPRKKRVSDSLRYFTPQQSLMFLKSLDLTYDYKISRNPSAEGEENINAVCGREKHYIVPTQYKLFYTLSLFCGFRKGETLALRWEDIDFEQQTIAITKSIGRTEHGFDCKETKNASGNRQIPIPDCISCLLIQYREEYENLRLRLGSQWQGDGSLFIRPCGQRMGHTTTYQHFVRHLKRYNQWIEDDPAHALAQGLETLPIIPLHGLRHSCATLLNYLGVSIVDISKYLGHANSTTTMNIYAHSFEAQKRAAGEKLDAFVKAELRNGEADI